MDKKQIRVMAFLTSISTIIAAINTIITGRGALFTLFLTVITIVLHRKSK